MARDGVEHLRVSVCLSSLPIQEASDNTSKALYNKQVFGDLKIDFRLDKVQYSLSTEHFAFSEFQKPSNDFCELHELRLSHDFSQALKVRNVW